MKPQLQLLGKQDRAAFSCGESSLDTYLKTQASQDMKRSLAACHVLIDQDNPSQIIGYYTLSNASIVLSDLPSDLAKKAGRYPLVPAVLLGRFAVDSQFQGRGIADVLLGDALLRVLHVSKEVGTMLVVVDALNEGVVGFYERRDFQRFEAYPLRLYLPINKIASMYPDEANES